MDTPNYPILVVGTEETFVHKLSQDLQEVGYSVVATTNTGVAWQELQNLQAAMVIIDRALPAEAGLKLCNRIRSAGLRIPVVLLMAKETVEDRMVCLESGADDYLLKPYRIEGLLQMIRFYLEPETKIMEQLKFGDLILDLASRRVIRAGRTIDLTMKEFELLKYLMAHPREVLTREQILENVWGYDFIGESNVIEVYIRYLRLKIEDDGERRLIQTVRGVGYVLREAQS
jgi:OmpR family response regulator NblR